MVVAARKDSETKVSLSFFFVCGLDFRKEHFPMPKTLPQRIVFTIVMATIMVYGMIVYNVALNTGGVTNATFGMALHEMPIMVPVAFVLEFFVVEKLATALAFTFMRPTDRPQFITYAISLMIVCIMCPVMSLVATLLFKEPSFGTWVHTWGCNFPMALCWQMFYCGPLSRFIKRKTRNSPKANPARCPHKQAACLFYRVASPPKLFEQIPCFCLTTPAGVCYYIFAD